MNLYQITQHEGYRYEDLTEKDQQNIDELRRMKERIQYFDFDDALYNPLWYVYTSIAKSLSDEFWVLQIIQSVIVNCIFFHFFRKFSPQYYFSAILLYYVGYYCYFNMEVMREALCICILLLATSWLLEKKWIKYILASFIAMGFHYSAAVMLCFPLFMLLFKQSSWQWQLLVLSAVLAVLNVVNVASLIISLLPIDEQLGMLVEKYIDIETSLMGMIAQVLKYLPVFGMIFIRSRFPELYPDKFAPIVMGVVFAYAMAMGFAGFERLVNYFIPFIIVYLVHTVYYFISKVDFGISQISHLALFLSLSLLTFNYTYYYMRGISTAQPGTSFYHRFAPYYSVLDPKIDAHRERYIENDREVSLNF